MSRAELGSCGDGNSNSLNSYKFKLACCILTTFLLLSFFYGQCAPNTVNSRKHGSQGTVTSPLYVGLSGSPHWATIYI